MLDYYFQIKKPGEFRYNLISAVKQNLIIQGEEEKLELIRQAKKDLFNEIKNEFKQLESLLAKFDDLLVDDELKKSVKKEAKEEKERAKILPKEDFSVISEPSKPKPSKEDIVHTKKSSSKSASFEKKPEKKVEPPRVEPQKESSQTSSFDYTLDQIEKKLSELKKD